MEGSKGNSPYGPNFVEGIICKNADREQGAAENDTDPASKVLAGGVLCRRSYFFDNAGGIFQNTIQEVAGVAASDNWHFYLNTMDNNRFVMLTSDIQVGASGNGRFVETVFKGNIASALGTGRPQNGNHWRHVRSNSTDGAYPDGWRGSLITDNIFQRTGGGGFEVALTGTGAATVGSIGAAETQWPAVWSGNSTTAPTYKSQGDRTSDDYDTAISAFELDTGSEGLGTGTAATQANGAGASSNTLTVDDSRFFVALGDANTYNMQYFVDKGFIPSGDYIKIVPAGQDPVANGEIV